MCICVCESVHLYEHVHTCAHIYDSAYMHVRVYCLCAYINVHMLYKNVSMLVYAHDNVHVYVSVCE